MTLTLITQHMCIHNNVSPLTDRPVQDLKCLDKKSIESNKNRNFVLPELVSRSEIPIS